jgi:hypothetical protein
MAIEADFHLQAKAIGGEKWGNQLVSILDAAGGDGTIEVTSVDASSYLLAPEISTSLSQPYVKMIRDETDASFFIDIAPNVSWEMLGSTSGSGTLLETVTCATGKYDTSLTANLADAWSITDGTTELLRFVTTTGAMSVTPVAGVGAAGGFTASPRNCHTGGVPAQATTAGTNAATNTAGTVYLAEVFVPCNCTATGIAIFNGTAVAGNGKVMLYDSAGNRLAISASTAMSGTTAYQLIPFTAALAVKGPATYFVGAIYDDTTHDLRGHTIGSFAVGTDAGNTYGTESTYATVTLPTTFSGTTGPIASLY